MKKIFCIFLFVFSSIIIILGKSSNISSVFLVDEFDYSDINQKYRFTDLFRLSKIMDYEEKCLKILPDYIMNNPDSADILVIGDSYFENVIGDDFISGDLQKISGKKVYNMTLATDGRAANTPYALIRTVNFNMKNKKILILESTERHSMSRAIKGYIKYDISARSSYNKINDIALKYFTFNDVVYFIEHNIILYPLICLKNTINFRMFGVIDRNIGAFSKEPPILFSKEEVEFNALKKSDHDLQIIADNIKLLSEKLNKEFNIILMYVIIPDKFSIYNNYANGIYSYSGYIPQLSELLDERGVYNLNLYEKFMDHKNISPDRIIFYKSDTHFNEYGKELFVKYASEKIKEIVIKEKILNHEEDLIKIKNK